MFPVVPAEVTAAGTLREDLIVTPTHSSACLQPERRRFSAVLAATAFTLEIVETLRERHIAGQREGIAACLRRAQERGEITAERVERLLAPGRLEIAAAVGVLVFQEDLLGAVLDVEGIAVARWTRCCCPSSMAPLPAESPSGRLLDSALRPFGRLPPASAPANQANQIHLQLDTVRSLVTASCPEPHRTEQPEAGVP